MTPQTAGGPGPAAPGPDGLPLAYRTAATSSFWELVTTRSPAVLPDGLRALDAAGSVPHATTIVALVFDGGVVLAGDRRATMGSVIAHREMEKVFEADRYSAIGIAGSAGIALELVRLFQLELEHYEKIEGTLLSLDGKANRLGTMLRGNLGLALQGLAVLPLFVGYDLTRRTGRIFSYDVTGGRYEEHEHHSVGSGSLFARGALKRLWRPGLDAATAVAVAVEALADAAEDDSATGGPDALRGIWPIVTVVTAEGQRRVTEAEIQAIAARVEAARAQRARDSRAARTAAADDAAATGTVGLEGEERP